MAITWTVKLKDDVSGPAGKASTALDKIAASLKKVKAAQSATSGPQIDKQSNAYSNIAKAAPKMSGFARAVQAVGNAFGPKAAGGVLNLGRKLSEWAPALEATGKAAKFAAAGFLAYAAAAGAVTYGAAKLAFSGVKQVRDAQAFRASTLSAFRIILKSDEAAQDAFDMAAKTSMDIGGDFQETMSSMNALMAQGFDPKAANQMIRSMADLQRINPQANMEGITRAIGQIRATGRLQGDELMQLNEAGLSSALVYDQIAKKLGLVAKNGKSASEQVQAMQKAGKISSDVAISGIMAAINQQAGGGPAGSVAMAAADASLEGSIARVMNLKEQMLGALKIDWSPLTNAVKSLLEAMQSPAGKQFFRVIGESVQKLVDQFGKMDQKSFEKMLALGSKAIAGITKGLVETMEAVDGVAKAMERLDAAIQRSSAGGSSLGDVLGGAAEAAAGSFRPLLWTIEAIASAITGISNAWSAVNEMFMGVGESIKGAIQPALDALSDIGRTAGENLGQGLIDGITSKTEGVSVASAALGGVAGVALDAALGNASPSKLARQSGRYFGQGLELGFDDRKPRVEASSMELGQAGLAAGRMVRNSFVENNTSNTTDARSSLVNNRTNNIVINGGDMGGASSLVEQLRGLMFSHG